MDCSRCGNKLHRLPMFDLPRRVQEFSCLCCGERFWTIEGDQKLSSSGQGASEVVTDARFSGYTEKVRSVSHQN